MYKKIAAVALVLACILLSARSAFGDDRALIRRQFVEYFTQQSLSDSAIEKQMKAMRPDGTWPDIDYASKRRGGWPTLNHLKRLVSLATAYADPESVRFQDPQLKAAILNGLNHWIEEDYTNPNWWQWRIGIPENMLTAFMLLGDDLPESMLNDAKPILNRSKMGQTGQNKVWCAGIAFMKGLLYANPELMDKAVAGIWSELRVSTEEGIQPDWSFHQHGPQQQFGNYGASFGASMVMWGSILRGTDYALSGERLEILSNYLLEGPSWILWNGRMDLSGCGRQIDAGYQQGKARGIQRQLKRMEQIDPIRQSRYEAVNILTGHKSFWRSEMAVHRLSNWYASVKMSSTRVIGSETCNDENMLGLHLGDGTLLTYQTGAEYEDLVPLWDWKRLPGTTCDQGMEKLAPKGASGGYGGSDFSGVLGDGKTGLASMIYKRGNLTARKSYFFLNDHIVCLGSGIGGETRGDVYTSVEQSWLTGDVTQGEGWIQHSGIAYQFLDGDPVSKAGRVEGNWLSSFPTRGDRPAEGNVFSLWINHGKSPKGATYAYRVVPRVGSEEVQSTILSNTEIVQAVACEGMIYAVFYEAGKLKVGKKRTIETDGPCLIQVSDSLLTVADPTHTLDTLRIRLNGKSYKVKLPQGAERGNSVAVH